MDQSLDNQRVTRAGQRVHGHAPASESHALLVELPLVGVHGCPWISTEHRLADEIREIQRIAHVCHPTEQICQAHQAKTVRHVNDGHQVLLQGRLVVLVIRLALIVETIIDVAAFGNWFLGTVGGLRLERTEGEFLDW